MPASDSRIPILYLAPWVDIGGSDKGTIDWFRFLDRDHFRGSLITTQPSANRRLTEVIPFADEVWDLPDLMPGDEFARFIATFIVDRGIKVLHIMNSRLGFELLPDIALLPNRPRVVVQLHVEETDHSGYVRYVTTRYGNLVDAFSVSSQALSDRLGAYDVPVAKRRLIRTGVDAEREFCPGRIRPTPGLDPSLLQILFPARLTAQKNPLLMVEVAARLHAAGLNFRIHVLGDGDLIDAVRVRVAALGLEHQVLLHGECVDVGPWYAASDIVLLTSEYEGVPYVAYEAMAVATPLVAPELPGLREIITPDTGVLVSPPQDPDGYAAAIGALVADPTARQAIGVAARVRVRSAFPLERMASEHGSLYEELLVAVPEARSPQPRLSDPPRQLSGSLRSRRPGATPLVSVIIPCFNHGRYLGECLRSIADQTYDPIETIVVDDGSTDPETLQVLARIQRDGEATLVQMPTNRGPSAARNVALEHARGRYLLPVDADNVLLPDAVAMLVAQLSSAGEQIGFVYPNYQFFGNRSDYFEVPSYNLYTLLSSNYCDACSLIDREVFDRGFRYPEDIGLGHEDWDLVLSLAEHGIYGEPARAKTLLSRRHGFARSDLVEAGGGSATALARRHQRLFEPSFRARLKAQWNPALTVIALDPVPEEADALHNLVTAAARQTCPDFELVIQTADEVWPTALGPRLRRVSSRLAGCRAQVLALAVEIARGRYALAAYGSAAALLADPAVVEKMLRVLRANPRIDALAFAHSERRVPAFRLLDGEDVARAELGALCWATAGSTAPPASLELSSAQPLDTIARCLSADLTVQWRQLSRLDLRADSHHSSCPSVRIGARRHTRARDARARESAALLVDLPAGIASRLDRPGIWMPPQARVLCRHLHHGSGRYVFSNDRSSPAGCSLHYDLGCLRVLPLAGTTSLLAGRDDDAHPGFRLGEPTDIDAPELLGFVEQAPLPLLDALQLAHHLKTGQLVLVAGEEDPLWGVVEQPTTIGYIEPYPVHPRRPPHADVFYGLAGLLRSVDLGARRHRYGVARHPGGQPAGELGALLTAPTDGCEPLWVDDSGRVSTARVAPRNGRPPLRTAIRWTGAPLTWRGCGPVAPKLRATVRRAYDSTRTLGPTAALPSAQLSDPAGYLLRSSSRRTVPLYESIHPVTGDQLLATNEQEPRNLGYERIALLGHLIARAPVTGRLGGLRLSVPWASRFGQEPVPR